MADFYVNIFVDDEKRGKLEEVGLADQIKEIEGKSAVQVEVTKKEQKKLVKAFAGLEFDASNACVLPDDAVKTLMDTIVAAKSLDVMKVAILKLFNPLAGKGLREKTH